jgi:hypothetical protein
MSTTLQTAPAIAAPAGTSRIASVDIIRGAVMVIMAIDHVRVYSGLPAGGPTPGIFFTRWITHFCAPAFIFLAGTSIFFYARKHADVSRFLVIRGLWLILLELTILRLAWTFNFDFAHYEMAGVIWVIGCCMILMAVLVKLLSARLSAMGVHHRRSQPDDPHIGSSWTEWTETSSPPSGKSAASDFAGPVQFGPGQSQPDPVLYSTVPDRRHDHGYAFGKVISLETARRKRICLPDRPRRGCSLAARGFNLCVIPALASFRNLPDGAPSASCSVLPQLHEVSRLTQLPRL